MISNFDILESKIDDIANVKANIVNAVYGKGIFIPPNTPFRNFANYIDEIRMSNGVDINTYYIYNSVSGSSLNMLLQLFSVPALNIPNGVNNLSYAYANLYGIRFVENIDTTNVTNMASMFNHCSNLLEAPPMSVTNLNDGSFMFYNCVNLMEIPSFTFNNVKSANLYYAFANCKNLKRLPEMALNNKITPRMFQNCYNLIDASRLTIVNVSNTLEMFQNCYNLVNLPNMNFYNMSQMGRYVCEL